MNTVEEIASAVEKLTPPEFQRFREWLAEYDEQLWDKQIEEDAKAGRLDFLVARAQDDIKNGRVRPLDEVLENIAD